MSRPQILLVDDDRRVRQLVGLTLPADDYELLFAPDGAAAIRSTEWRVPDLIVVDFAMPGIDGVDVCTAIRANPATATTPIVMLTGHGDDEVRRRAVVAGANGFLTKPFSPLTLEQTIRSLLGASNLTAPSPAGAAATKARTVPPSLAADTGQQYAHRTAADVGGPALFDSAPAGTVSRERFADLHETFLSTIEALATALELRGADTEGHCQRVSLYTVAAARRLGVTDEELEQLRWGAILHDVGMIAVPDVILLKPGQLHPEEWALVKLHPELGARLLQHIPGLGAAMSIVRFHHERFDGAGYPLGLRGTAIPLGARIFAVADALDAITTGRPYRPARTWEQARVEILQGRGSHFDPAVVDAYLEIFDDLQGLTVAEHPIALYV
jgi:response regulator RpfG family c-di-GMP phosphodiesterase